MAEQDIVGCGVHDLGGQPGGPIDRSKHAVTLWEQRIDALMTLLADGKRGLIETAELRRGIESLGADAYHAMSYYERWAASIAAIVVEKGVVTRDELELRAAEIRARAERDG